MPRTDEEKVTSMFETGEDDETRLGTVVGVAINIAHDFVNDRLADGYADKDDAENRLERFETLAACHILHAPYPHEDEAEVGDGSITFSGSGLGNTDQFLDADGLRETRYGRMLHMADTEDALTRPEEKSDWSAFGATSGNRAGRDVSRRW